VKKLILILLCVPIIGFGQEWTFGGQDFDHGFSVQQTTDGGYIIAGNTMSYGNGGEDIILIKTNSSGIEQWSKTFGGTNNEFGYSVQQTSDGGYIISGMTMSFGNGSTDIYLIKTDLSGNEQWTKTLGGTGIEDGSAVQQTTDGGYIIIGSTSSFGNGGGDVYLIKTNSNGVEQWSKTFGGSSGESGYSGLQTIDGGYIACGRTLSFGNGSADVFLVKTDSSGVEQWSKTFGGSGYDVCWSIQQTNNGGYIISGDSHVGGVGQNIYLIKTDANGIEEWSKTFSEGNEGNSVQQTTDGGYIITGDTYSSNSLYGGYEAAYLIKTDANGVEEWSKSFAGIYSVDSIFSNYGSGWSVQQTNDGGYIITGGTYSYFYGGYDIYLIKTDNNGNVTSTFNIPFNPNRKLQNTVDLLGREIKPQKNITFIEIYDDGTVEKKLIVE
tara:strand:+ start:101 stop:1414 length:1314 start_codon:yes stop_codon:yes gene_type:complete